MSAFKQSLLGIAFVALICVAALSVLGQRTGRSLADGAYVADCFAGRTGGDAAETSVTSTYGVLKLSLTKTLDPTNMFAVSASGDEVCYSGTLPTTFFIEAPISFERTSGGGSEIFTLAFAKGASSAIGNGDEFGDEYQREMVGTGPVGMGALGASVELSPATPCLSILIKTSGTTPGITLRAMELKLYQPAGDG